MTSVRTIWEYPLQIVDVQFIPLPLIHEILTIQLQGKDICLWSMVDPQTRPGKIPIYCFGTGNPGPILRDYKYIATVQQNGFVRHFYKWLWVPDHAD